MAVSLMLGLRLSVDAKHVTTICPLPPTTVGVFGWSGAIAQARVTVTATMSSARARTRRCRVGSVRGASAAPSNHKSPVCAQSTRTSLFGEQMLVGKFQQELVA